MKQFGVKREDINLIRAILSQLRSEVIANLQNCAEALEWHCTQDAEMSGTEPKEHTGWNSVRDARDMIKLLKGLKL